MATHSSILAWRIPWTEEPGELQSMESQRVRQNWMTNTYLLHIFIYMHTYIYFHFNLLRDIEYSSLCYTVGLCCLPVLYIIVFVSPRFLIYLPPPHPSPTRPLGNHKEDVVCIYNGILANLAKKCNNAICSDMDGPKDDHTKWSNQKEKDNYCMYYL